MKILIVDDHPVLREGLATLLLHGLPDVSVIQAETVAAALDLIAAHADLDLVVIDLLMPDVEGMAAVAEIGRARADLPTIVYSSSEDAEDARRALAAGALGYVPKSANPNVLLSAVHIVLGGDVYVPPLILGVSAGIAAARLPVRIEPETLTRRQIDVLTLLSQGCPNKVIATRLDLSEKTVKAHVTAIFKALNVVNRTQAASAARSAGLI